MRYIVLFLFAFTSAAMSDTLKGGYGACVSEELLDQLTDASVNEDKNALQYLSENGCILSMKGGLPISILDTTWTGAAKVRVYLDGGRTIELWTYMENLDRGE